jgi:hypothetical protein
MSTKSASGVAQEQEQGQGLEQEQGQGPEQEQGQGSEQELEQRLGQELEQRLRECHEQVKRQWECDQAAGDQEKVKLSQEVLEYVEKARHEWEHIKARYKYEMSFAEESDGEGGAKKPRHE